MTSLQKQASDFNPENPEEFVKEFENKLLLQTMEEAETTIKKLKYLGVNFDPFSTGNDEECLQIMDNLGLTAQVKNPYLATNILLRLLDKTEERINNLKQ